jgi:ADP-ribosyl-[dinitrogen reductase] hydrolase
VAANLGDDADSVAAAAGQLAGALYGAAAIPEGWLQRLAWRSRIADTAEKLFQAAPFS